MASVTSDTSAAATSLVHSTRSRTRNTHSTSMNSSLSAASASTVLATNDEKQQLQIDMKDQPVLEKEKKRKKATKLVNAQEVIKTIENEARQAELLQQQQQHELDLQAEKERKSSKTNKKTKKVNFKDVSLGEEGAVAKTPSKLLMEHQATPLKPKRGRKKKSEQLGESTPAPELVPIEAAVTTSVEPPTAKVKKATKKGKKTTTSAKSKKTNQEGAPAAEEEDKLEDDFKLELENESNTENAAEMPPTLIPIVATVPEPTPTAVVATNTVTTEPEKETQEAPKPKRTGGARIVIPKEVTSIVKLVTKENGEVEEQVEKVVSEARDRKAGPRIVIPVIVNQQETNHQSKRKLPDAGKDTTAIKKLKEKAREGSAVRVNTLPTASKPESPSSKPIKALAKPDFQSIHQKQMEGMESIDDHNKRVMQRHAVLTGCKPASSSTPQQATTVGDISNLSAIKPTRAMSLNRNPAMPSSTTPNQNKKPQMKTATSTSQLSSQIPVMVKKTATENVQPTTNSSSTTDVNNVSLKEALKTPTRKIQRDTQALNRSALKSKTNDLNASTDKQMPIQLATSSFVRRKSFDLNASLSRELHYKPYTGKLKPIDLEIKPVVTCSLGKLMSNNSQATTSKN